MGLLPLLLFVRVRSIPRMALDVAFGFVLVLICRGCEGVDCECECEWEWECV